VNLDRLANEDASETKKNRFCCQSKYQFVVRMGGILLTAETTTTVTNREGRLL
jgi:hypothetical protein